MQLIIFSYFLDLAYIYIYIYSNRKTNNFNLSFKSSLSFAINRIKKIYPIYILSILLILPVTIYNTFKFTSNALLSLAKLLIKIVMCLTLTQSLTGISDFSRALNGVSWFLSCLFICYMLLPFLYRTINKISNKRSAIIMLLFTIIANTLIFIILNKIDNLNIGFLNMTINDIEHGHPISRIGLLIIGMLISKIYTMDCINFNIITEYFMLTISVTYYLFSNFISSSYLANFLNVLCSCIFFLSIINGKTMIVKTMSYNTKTNLSILSMIIFLLHYPINQTIGFIILYNRCLFDANTYLYLIAFTVEIALDVAMCWCVYKKYTKKIMDRVLTLNK